MSHDAQNYDINLHGRVAIVTGGARGLGRACAQALAIAGATVAVNDISEPELSETIRLIEDAGGRCTMFIADVSDQRSLQRGVASVEQEVGAVDLLINNAGVVGPIQPTWEVESDQWRHTFEVNLFGAFACIQAVLPGMVTRKRGRIINISSGAAYNIFPYLTAYATSKAALTHLTKCLAAETKEYGISVFAYNPGFIRTGMLEWAAASAEVHDLSRGIFNKVLEEGQARPVEQVIPMFMFLASGKADVFSGRYFTSLDNPDELAQRTEEILRDNLFTLDLRK